MNTFTKQNKKENMMFLNGSNNVDVWYHSGASDWLR